MNDITEKERRIYYQDIVYAVCRDLDKILPDMTVCGTADDPTTDVQDRMKMVRKVLAYVPSRVLIEAKDKAGCPTIIKPAKNEAHSEV